MLQLLCSYLVLSSIQDVVSQNKLFKVFSILNLQGTNYEPTNIYTLVECLSKFQCTLKTKLENEDLIFEYFNYLKSLEEEKQKLITEINNNSDNIYTLQQKIEKTIDDIVKSDEYKKLLEDYKNFLNNKK